jgi:hypothetical protein
MKSLSILCVGGRGQPSLAGGGGEGVWNRKSRKIKKVDLLQYIPSTKYLILVDKKMC